MPGQLAIQSRAFSVASQIIRARQPAARSRPALRHELQKYLFDLPPVIHPPPLRHPDIVRRCIQNPVPLEPLQIPRHIVYQPVRRQECSCPRKTQSAPPEPTGNAASSTGTSAQTNSETPSPPTPQTLRTSPPAAASPSGCPASPQALRKTPPYADTHVTASRDGPPEPHPSASDSSSLPSSDLPRSRGYKGANAHPAHRPAPHPYLHRFFASFLGYPALVRE